MHYDIVRYRPEFAEQVAQLQTHLWNRDVAVNAAFLEWKYHRNPYIRTPIIHLALHGGRVVGMRGMLGARWEVGLPAERFVVPCAGDLVIVPEHRNQGLLARLIQTAVDDLAGSGYDYIFNLSASPVTQLASFRTGWRSVGPLEHAARLPSPSSMVPPVLRKHAGRLPLVARCYRGVRSVARRLPLRRPKPAPSHPFVSLDRNAASGRAARRHGVSVEDAPRCADMADVVRRLGTDGRIRHVRDEEYLAWRYSDPRSHYRFLFSGKSGLDGYLALRAPTHARGGAVDIVDWEATRDEVRSQLLAAAIALGEFPKLTIWSATLSPDVKAILMRHGFGVSTAGSLGRAHRADEDRPTVLVRPVRRAVPDAGDWVIRDRPLLDLASWDLRMLYRDS